jgi:hypothetical protein
LKSSDVQNWRHSLKPHGGQQVDLTPLACGDRVRQELEAAGGTCAPFTACCPLSAERGEVHVACQRELYGSPVWKVEEGVCEILPADNPFIVKIKSGQCLISVEGTMGGPSSERWTVRAANPPCELRGSRCATMDEID